MPLLLKAVSVTSNYKMFRFITIFILVPTLSFGQVPNVPSPSREEAKLWIDGSPEYVVLPKFKSFVFNKNYKSASLTGKETKVVRNLIKQKLLKDGTKESKLKKYKLQLIAAINPAGDKVVFINGFCSVPSKWQREFVFVKDGGDCYFQAKVNLRTRRLLSFSFNGEA
jgi:hypothetical protein